MTGTKPSTVLIQFEFYCRLNNYKRLVIAIAFGPSGKNPLCSQQAQYIHSRSMRLRCDTSGTGNNSIPPPISVVT
jgi:hypothetical protein